jgi:hypothetical protein
LAWTARPWNPTALDRIVGHGKSVKGSSLLVGKTLRKQGAITMPQENDLEGVQDQGGKHGGQKACRSLSPGLQLGVSRGAAMLPIKASCAMSGDRSSRATRSGLSK